MSYCFETEGSVFESTSPLVSVSGILNENEDEIGRRIGCEEMIFQGPLFGNRGVESLMQVGESSVGNCRKEDMSFPVSEHSTFKETKSEPGKTEQRV